MALKKFLYIIICAILLSIAFFIYGNIVSWGDCRDDEVWIEDVEVEPEVYIGVIHTKGCCVDKPYFKNRIKIDKSFSKNKNMVYDYCIDDELALILNAISYRYNKRFIEWAWFFDETEEERKRTNEREELMDTTFQVRNCRFGYSKDHLVRLKNDTDVQRLIIEKYFEIKYKLETASHD